VYGLYEPISEIAPQQETEIEKALARPTSDDDTHSGPRDRFSLTAPLPEPECGARGRTVWELFDDREALLRRQVEQVEKNIAAHRGQEPSSAHDEG